jgi:hypothetical protein
LETVCLLLMSHARALHCTCAVCDVNCLGQFRCGVAYRASSSFLTLLYMCVLPHIREYAGDKKKKFKPVIISHHMLAGLKEGQEKMSKSDPDSAIFMEGEPTVRSCATDVVRWFCVVRLVVLLVICDRTTPGCDHYHVGRRVDCVAVYTRIFSALCQCTSLIYYLPSGVIIRECSRYFNCGSLCIMCVG